MTPTDQRPDLHLVPLPERIARDRDKFPSLKTDLGKTLLSFWTHLAMLADQKQQDYGSENLTMFGPMGVMVRMQDKISRLRNIYLSGALGAPQPAVKTESALDTWGDWIVYEAIGYLMAAGIWPQTTGAEEEPPLPLPRVQAQWGGLEQRVPPSEVTEMVTDLLFITRQLVHDQARKENIPDIGDLYKDKRVPMFVRVLGVLPSYSVTRSVTQHFVMFTELNDTTSQTPQHLRVEPLDWFNHHYQPEV